MSDTDALDEIRAILDGTEWDAETAALVADAVRATGRPVRGLEGHVVEPEDGLEGP